MTDWESATDPVQRREAEQAELTSARRAAGYRRKSRPQRKSVELQPWVLDEEFEEMEA